MTSRHLVDPELAPALEVFSPPEFSIETLQQGRDFTPADKENSPKVAIINTVMAQRYWPQGNAIGSTIVVESASITLERGGVTIDDVRWFAPHQANVRIIEAAGNRLGIPAERTLVNIDRYGNTSAASIPLVLAEAADDGRLQPGDLVLLSSFGAGLTWGSALLRWGRP